jgi:hypothetical protein
MVLPSTIIFAPSQRMMLGRAADSWMVLPRMTASSPNSPKMFGPPVRRLASMDGVEPSYTAMGPPPKNSLSRMTAADPPSTTMEVPSDPSSGEVPGMPTPSTRRRTSVGAPPRSRPGCRPAGPRAAAWSAAAPPSAGLLVRSDPRSRRRAHVLEHESQPEPQAGQTGATPREGAAPRIRSAPSPAPLPAASSHVILDSWKRE